MGAGRSYEDFVAHVTARATGGDIPWTSDGDLTAGIFRTTATNATLFGAMAGSVWMAYCAIRPQRGRMIQHAMPSEAEWNKQRAAGRVVMFRVVQDVDRVIFYALNRNGYESALFADGNPYPAFLCDECAYWDEDLGRAMKTNPQAGTGPSPYDW